MRSTQEALNQAALEEPKPGDLWREMFCPVVLVIAVINAGNERFVVYSYARDHVVDSTDGRFYEYQLTGPEARPFSVTKLEAFKEQVCYPHHCDEFFCDVTRERVDISEDAAIMALKYVHDYAIKARDV